MGETLVASEMIKPGAGALAVIFHLPDRVGTRLSGVARLRVSGAIRMRLGKLERAQFQGIEQGGHGTLRHATVSKS